MANVNSIVSGSAEEIAQLRIKAEQMGRELPVSAEEAAKGFYQLASAGKSATDIMSIADGVMKTSIATATDFATTSAIVTAAQDVWKYSNEELTEAEDTLLNVVKGFKTTLPELGISLQYVGKMAQTLGIDLATTGGMIGMLRQEGLDASTAGTGLRMTLAKLSSAATATEGPLVQIKEAIVSNANGSLNLQATLQNLRPILNQFGTDAEKVAFLNQVFGARAATAAKILIDQANNINSTADAMRQSGSMMEAYDVQAQGTQNQLEILNSTYEEQQRILGEKLLPTQIKLLELKIKLLETMNSLPGPLGDIAGGFMLATGEMSSFLVPLGMILNSMSILRLRTIKATASLIAHKIATVAATVATWAHKVAQDALNISMIANPIGLVIAAIVVLIAIVVAIIAYYDKMSVTMKRVALAFLFLLGPITAVIAIIILLVKHWDEVKVAIYAIGDAFVWLGDMIKKAVKWYVNYLITFWSTVFKLGKMVYQFAANFAKNLFQGIVDVASRVWDKVWGALKKVFDFGKKAYEAGKDFLKQFVDGIVNTVSAVTDPIKNVAGKIAGFFGGSPPHYGPLKEAMDKGGPAFIEGYVKNMLGTINIPGGMTDNSRRITPGG